jgi:hypothetical protein
MRFSGKLALALSFAATSCDDSTGPTACTREGAGWVVRPSPVEVAIGETVHVTVTEVSCSGQIRVPVYPPLVIDDPAIAVTNSTYRTIRGLKADTAVLTLIDESGDVGHGPTEVIVR